VALRSARLLKSIPHPIQSQRIPNLPAAGKDLVVAGLALAESCKHKQHDVTLDLTSHFFDNGPCVTGLIALVNEWVKMQIMMNLTYTRKEESKTRCRCVAYSCRKAPRGPPA
jgi:hypothetical protein